MSSIMFNYRLQFLRNYEKYSEAINKFEKIICENNGKLPNVFYLEDVSVSSIKIILKTLKINNFSITAPDGALSSKRKIILPKNM